MAKAKQQENKKQENTKPAPMPLSQAIRQAGENTLSKQEIKAITKDTGKSSAQVIQKLDQINEKLKEKDKVGINLSSGASNMLIREASNAAPGYDNFLGLGAPTFGTGKIGQTIQSMAGSKATGGYINPQSGKQSITPAVPRTLLPRGMDLMPSGRQTVRGIGQQYTYTGGTSGAGPYNAANMPFTNRAPGVGPGPWANPTGNDDDGTTNDDDGTTNGGDGTTNNGGDGTTNNGGVTPPTPPGGQDALANQYAYDLANWSTGYRRRGSSRSRGPRNARTLGGATRFAPTTNTLGY